MYQRSSIAKYLTDRRRTFAFWAAAALGLALAIGANVLTYIQTRGAAGFDGVEVIGFPFVFRRFGGFAQFFEFSHLALTFDIIVALAFSFSAGAVARRLIGLRRRRVRFAWCAGPLPIREPWQFSLRQLLLVVAIVAAACAADKCLVATLNHRPYF